MKRWTCRVSTFAAFMMICLVASSGAARRGFCADPGQFCGRTVDIACLERVGAGVVASIDADCAEQIRAYGDCLSLVAAQCGAPETPEPAAQSADAPSAAEALAIWGEIKESDDPEVLDAFAESYPNGPLATLARKRAASLRDVEAAGDDDAASAVEAGLDEARLDKAPREDDALTEAERRSVTPEDVAASFAPLAKSWNAHALSGFLRAYPESAEAAAARARLSELAALQLEAQSHLNRLGYDVGREDGVWGQRSRGGLQAFERAHGLEETGVLSDFRLDTLRAAPTPPKAQSAEKTTPDAEIETPEAPIGLTARLRISLNRLRAGPRRCAARLETPDRALSIRNLEIDCGGPLTLSLETSADGRLRSGEAVYDGYIRMSLNGADWGFSGFYPTQTPREVKQIVVRVSFVE